MNMQAKTTIAYGTGKDGKDRADRWKAAYKEAKYDGLGPFIREVMDWVITHAIWKKGEGIVGFKNPES